MRGRSRSCLFRDGVFRNRVFRNRVFERPLPLEQDSPALAAGRVDDEAQCIVVQVQEPAALGLAGREAQMEAPVRGGGEGKMEAPGREGETRNRQLEDALAGLVRPAEVGGVLLAAGEEQAVV